MVVFLTLMDEQTINIIVGYSTYNRGKSIMLLSVLYLLFTYLQMRYIEHEAPILWFGEEITM